MLKPTERFSDRVAEYLKYRPSYPAGVLDRLEQQCNLTQTSVIADFVTATIKAFPYR